MPVTLWKCHDSFWENRRFVTWQLLRRNLGYRRDSKRLSKDRGLFFPRRSYPPSSPNERFERWQQWIELFVAQVWQPGELKEFVERLAEPPIQSSPPQPDQFAFRDLVDRRELRRKIPYKDLFLGELTGSNRPLPIPKMKEFGLKQLKVTPVDSGKNSLMAIRIKGRVVDVSMPFHNRSDRLVVIPLVDHEVDFPPPAFLPRFTRFPPSVEDKKAYSSYLYDQKVEPYKTGRGPTPNVKDALRVWDLTKKQKMRDAEIARTLFGLEYQHGNKSADLQKVHDLKVWADKAIRAIYP